MAWSLSNVPLLSSNASDDSLCESLPEQKFRNSCYLSHTEAGTLDSIAGVRIITSLLGLMGACSIIVSVIVKRRVRSPEVHPIFMLSLADCCLSILWILGSCIWFTDGIYEQRDRTVCYVVTLLTGILECVSINLCVLYAVFAYLGMRKTSVNSLLMNQHPYSSSRLFLVVSYSVSWLLPAIVVVSMFAISNKMFNFLSSTKECSCWCRPTVVNILPSAHFNEDNDSEEFMKGQLSFMFALSVTISAQYIVVFVLLVLLYISILFHIRKLKKEIGIVNFLLLILSPCIYKGRREDLMNYGATAMISQGQNQARKRVLIFLTAFVITGFFNLCSELFLLPFVIQILKEDHIGNASHVYFTLLFAQSITLPTQGFVNAIVYGWSRQDFMNVMSTQREATIDDNEHIYSDREQRSLTASQNSLEISEEQGDPLYQ